MTFLAPGFFIASLAVATVIVALHFIVTRQPRAAVLPTARFVPDMPAVATSRATRPYDLLLMLLRVLLVLAAGAGLAKPVLKPSRKADARVILVDVSRSVKDSVALRDSLRSVYRDLDAVVLFDSAAKMVNGEVAGSIADIRPTHRRGNLSAALVTAIRAGSALRERADSIQLVIISPVAAEEIDAATGSIRALWPGGARLIRIGSLPASATATGGIEIAAPATDPLRVTVDRARGMASSQVMIVRGEESSAASAANQGSVVIMWPSSGRPPGAAPRARSETIGGVIANDAMVVAPFERRWMFPADSLRDAAVIARWVDGEPAAIERADGAGCVRSVAVPVSPIGDLVVRRDFVNFVLALSGGCAGALAFHSASAQSVSVLQGKGGFAARDAFLPRGDSRSDLSPPLIGLALLAALVELFVRRKKGKVVSSEILSHQSDRVRAA